MSVDTSHTAMNNRPMQIVHDFRILSRYSGDPHTGLAALKAQGIGGIVANMPFENYMQDADTWQQFRYFLRACREEGLRVWIYDEKGYPSGFAGGQALVNHPELEATGLYFDEMNGSYTEEASYEGTHNCNNYFARARTINLLEREAVARFIQVTHERYVSELGEDLDTVEAFFTDEPSLNVLYLPPIPAASNVPVLDAPDPDRKLLPGVPWSKALKKEFGGQNLSGLFIDKPDSTSLRRRFYGQVNQFLAQNCFGQIRTWCQKHGKYSSGHLLWEEDAAYHTPMYGNFLRNLMQLDIPGIDVLSASPLSGYQYSRRAAALAASAAMLNGTRRIFTESSDFLQQMEEKRVASVDEAITSLAWQAAMGVTNFTYYFSYGVCPELSDKTFNFIPEDQKQLYRTPEDFLQINQATTNLVEKLSPATLHADVFLYYPVELLQAAYHPVMRPWEPGAKPEKLSRIAESYEAALGELLDNGIIPCVIDGEMLKNIQKGDGKDYKYTVLGASAKAVLYPEGCKPPDDCLPTIQCEILPMSSDLPGRLFDTGKAQFLKDNPKVCMGILKNEPGFLLILANLTSEKQDCVIKTINGALKKQLSPYQVNVEEWTADAVKN